MPKPRHPFDIALLTISLAIGIPLVLLMFGALRTRQLQSKANPRWAQFAKSSTPQASLFSESNDSRSVIRTASIRKDSNAAQTSEARPPIESNLTGSFIEQPTIDIAHTESESVPADPAAVPDEYEPVETAPILFRAVDDEEAIKSAQATERFESLLEEIRLRLDQIAIRQLEHHADDITRESQFLESLTQRVEAAIAKSVDSANRTGPTHEISQHPDPWKSGGVRTPGIATLAKRLSLVKFKNTSREYDFAIQGDGFFQIMMPDGDFLYTRQGSFGVNKAGELTTADGYAVQPPIRIPHDIISLTVSKDGVVAAIAANAPTSATVIGALTIACFADPDALSAEGHNRFAETIESGAPMVARPGTNGVGILRQGFLERLHAQASNLDDPAPPRPSAKQATPAQSSSEPFESVNPPSERASEFDEPVRPKTEPAKIRRSEDQPSFEPSDADAAVKPPPVKRMKPSVGADVDQQRGYSSANHAPDSPGDSFEAPPVHQQPVPPTQPSLITPYEPPPAPESIHIERGPDGTDLFSMDIRDADIREFFHKISEATRISILPSPEVQGRITLNLHQVQLETAFKAIIKSRGYVCEREDDIVIVSTREEASRLKDQHRTLVMKIYQPIHLEAAELNRLIEPLLSPVGRHSVTSSGRIQQVSHQVGSVHESPAPRDAVIVQDVAEVHGQIEQILVDLDVAPLQVEIEARILLVRLTGRFEHGVDLCQLPCHTETTDALGSGGLKLGRVSCQVPSFIRAIEQVADARLVTSQRIQVLNKHKAEMLIGDRIADPSQPAGSAVEGGTRLVFCPSISMDGSIKMEIHPERSTAMLVKHANTVRQTTSELTTHVLVRDGATVAVGGLTVEQPISKRSRVPLMNSIPAMGSSLRHRREGMQRTELVILITPRIVSDCDSSGFGQAVQQVSMSTATSFRERQCGVNQQQMARAHYNRALGYYQQGNYVKARQQIDVALCENRSDADAVQLRNQIATCLSQRAAR